MSIQSPTKESQEAMQAKTQAVPPMNVGGGLPEGGTAGQVLTKTATGAAWDDVPEELPTEGTAGQVLTKTADGCEWANAASGFSYKRIGIIYNGSAPITGMTSFTDITSNCSVDQTSTHGSTPGGFSGDAYPYIMKIGNFIGSVIARRSPEAAYDTKCFLTGILKDSIYGFGSGILTFMLASTIVKTETGSKPTIDKLWVKYEPYTPST